MKNEFAMAKEYIINFLLLLLLPEFVCFFAAFDLFSSKSLLNKFWLQLNFKFEPEKNVNIDKDDGYFFMAEAEKFWFVYIITVNMGIETISNFWKQKKQKITNEISCFASFVQTPTPTMPTEPKMKKQTAHHRKFFFGFCWNKILGRHSTGYSFILMRPLRNQPNSVYCSQLLSQKRKMINLRVEAKPSQNRNRHSQTNRKKKMVVQNLVQC